MHATKVKGGTTSCTSAMNLYSFTHKKSPTFIHLTLHSHTTFLLHTVKFNDIRSMYNSPEFFHKSASLVYPYLYTLSFSASLVYSYLYTLSFSASLVYPYLYTLSFVYSNLYTLIFSASLVYSYVYTLSFVYSYLYTLSFVYSNLYTLHLSRCTAFLYHSATTPYAPFCTTWM